MTNRYIIALEDSTQIVLGNKSLSLTGEDPVEEEILKRKLILNQKNDYNYYVKI